MSIINQAESSAPKALIVDDSLTQRLLLNHMLDELGYEVTAAKDGQEAINLFDPEQVDVIFMDIEMPIMDGIEATRIIRRTLAERFIPIIFITGGDSDKYLDQCIEVGGSDFIKKPFNANVLSAKTRSLLKIKQLYNEQMRQKAKIEAFQEQETQEHEAAAAVYENIVSTGYMQSPNLHSALSPMSKFNGDLLLCAYTPADKLNVLLGDFTGHGITASLASAPAAEIFYGMTAKGFGIREITAEINFKLQKLLPVNMFLAATLACLDRENHNLSTITCGLPEHLLFCTESGDIKTIPSNNLPLGIIESHDLQLVENHHHVRSSQQLIMFTDGVIETENDEGQAFDMIGVRDCLSLGRESCFDNILQALDAHRGQQAQQDDITLVRLSCDFSAEKWGLHELHNKPVHIEPSSWKTSSTMDFNTLKRLNPVPALVSSLMEIQGLTPFRESIFLVVTELFVNALEHGLLNLNSNLKFSADGFAQFFDLKQQRLEQLSEGSIKLIFTHAPYNNGGKLTIRVQDTGEGFEPKNISSPLIDNQQYSGRGLELVKTICDSLEYTDGGRQATAVFIWQND